MQKLMHRQKEKACRQNAKAFSKAVAKTYYIVGDGDRKTKPPSCNSEETLRAWEAVCNADPSFKPCSSDYRTQNPKWCLLDARATETFKTHMQERQAACFKCLPDSDSAIEQAIRVEMRRIGLARSGMPLASPHSQSLASISAHSPTVPRPPLTSTDLARQRQRYARSLHVDVKQAEDLWPTGMFFPLFVVVQVTCRSPLSATPPPPYPLRNQKLPP